MSGVYIPLPFLDFFAGSGLVTEGLKSYFTAVWANDNSPKKAAVFCANHKKDIFKLGPIELVQGKDLPSSCLSWGSFPCQDLSLAGNLNGIMSQRSGLVWQWLRVMDEMASRPPIAVAENVIGLVSADKGSHYRHLHNALVERGYRVGAIVLDAINWVPQSRKRVFVVAVSNSLVTAEFESAQPLWCHPPAIQRVAEALKSWIWWRLPKPTYRKATIDDIVDQDAAFVYADQHRRLIDLIPPKHLEKVKNSPDRFVFPGYKRIRDGKQVLELRFDGTAGCLRTPQGGSSRQYFIIKNNGFLNVRLITVKEAKALMGVRKDYRIPGTYNDGYWAMGDAVAVPVVRYLARNLLFPLARIAMENAP
ncbi:DNA-cytosine methyltransferase [Candidatus Zixiibacteriota bacterium]|nr:DNA-cytosine methyltransferase [candidate division Zixibacteria bacterium]